MAVLIWPLTPTQAAVATSLCALLAKFKSAGLADSLAAGINPSVKELFLSSDRLARHPLKSRPTVLVTVANPGADVKTNPHEEDPGPEEALLLVAVLTATTRSGTTVMSGTPRARSLG